MCQEFTRVKKIDECWSCSNTLMDDDFYVDVVVRLGESKYDSIQTRICIPCAIQQKLVTQNQLAENLFRL